MKIGDKVYSAVFSLNLLSAILTEPRVQILCSSEKQWAKARYNLVSAE
jgi:hypothetical protein